MNTIIEPARELTVTKQYDTVVCGGGIAGVSAALASAANGAKTLLIEREFMLGGLATAGLIAIYLPLCDGMGRQVSFGLAEELLRLSLRHGTDAPNGVPTAWLENGSIDERIKKRFRTDYNPQVYAVDLEAMLLEKGVDLLYGTVVCGVNVADGIISHIINENKSGRTAVAVKTGVDATGDADIVHLSGEEEALFGQGNVLAAWYYAAKGGQYRIVKLGACDVPDEEKTLKRTKPLTERRFGGIDADELTEQVLLSHKISMEDFFKKGSLGGDYSLATLATIPQVRMTRRLNGGCVMHDKDMHTAYADSVGLFSDWRKRGPVYELRYAALHGSRVKNLICAGRNISVTDAMWDITRVIPVCAVSGQAAGTAAAMFSDFTAADVPALQRQLEKDGVILHESELIPVSHKTL